MAYTNSGELSPGASYQLGEYTISLTATPDPGESTTGINVRCDKGEERARVATEVTGTVESWHVEANDTTADVYVTYKPPEALPTVNYAITSACSDTYAHPSGVDVTDNFDAGVAVCMATYITNSSGTGWTTIFAAEFPFTVRRQSTDRTSGTYTAVSATWGEKTYYYTSHGWNIDPTKPYSITCTVPINNYYAGFDIAKIAAGMLYGSSGGGEQTELVARFAIDLHDAGGTGPGSPWNDSGDYDESHDPDDPTEPRTTLNLTINGALSGRHNDPLNDTSYSYVPADRAAQTVYGSGGDGGNGGGGGAGASTIIVRKFGTDKADSKNLVCKPKRHGYGSGGGAGAKGGDGCILIFW